MASIKSSLPNAFLVVLSTFITIFFIETLLHLTPLKFKYLYSLEPAGYLTHDAEIGFDIIPSFATGTHAFADASYSVWSNSIGCFDFEYDGKSPYIYITGDSFTWGFSPFEDKWGKEVERQTGMRTLTCGVNAFGTRQEFIKTRRDLKKITNPPRYILVGYFEGNDLGDDYAFPNFTVHKGYRVPNMNHCNPEIILSTSPTAATSTCNVAKPNYTLLQKVKFLFSVNSVLYMMAQRHGVQDKIKNFFNFEQVSWPNTDTDQKLAWDIHKKSIESFKVLASEYNTKLLFVLIPDRETVRAMSMPGPMSVHERIKSTLDSKRIEYIDLLPQFREKEKILKEALYWPINEHMNTFGNKLTGDIVAQYLNEKFSNE